MANPSVYNSLIVTNETSFPIIPTTPAQSGWDGSIIGINGFGTSTSQVLYEQQLTLVPFTNGLQTLPNTANNNTGTLAMPYSIVSNGQTYNNPVGSIYSLIIAQSNNGFPVYNFAPTVGASPNETSATSGTTTQTGHYCTVPSTQTSVENMIAFPPPSSSSSSSSSSGTSSTTTINSSSGANAYVFLQNYLAYPTSSLAQGFASALKNPGQNYININNFFLSTTNYTNVNFNMYNLVQTYAYSFAYVWANFQNSYTYYFYNTSLVSGDYDKTKDNVDLVNTPVKQIGTVVLNSIPNTNLNNPGYTITYTPTGGQAVELTLSNGQFVYTDPSTGIQEICLQPTFIDKSYATGSQSDYGTPIQALVGTIYGSAYTGYPVQIANSPGTQMKVDLGTVQHSATFMLLEVCIPICIGTMFLCKGLYAGGKWIQSKFGGNTAEAKNALKDNPEATSDEDALDDEVQDQMDNLTPDGMTPAKVPTNPDDLTNAQQTGAGKIDNSLEGGEQEDQLEEQFVDEEEQIELANNPTVRNEEKTTEEDEEDDESIYKESVDGDESSSQTEAALESNENAIQTNQETIEQTNADQQASFENKGASEETTIQTDENQMNEDEEDEEEGEGHGGEDDDDLIDDLA